MLILLSFFLTVPSCSGITSFYLLTSSVSNHVLTSIVPSWVRNSYQPLTLRLSYLNHPLFYLTAFLFFQSHSSRCSFARWHLHETLNHALFHSIYNYIKLISIIAWVVVSRSSGPPRTLSTADLIHDVFGGASSQRILFTIFQNFVYNVWFLINDFPVVFITVLWQLSTMSWEPSEKLQMKIFLLRSCQNFIW